MIIQRATYACVNLGTLLRRKKFGRSICIDGDAGEVLEKLK